MFYLLILALGLIWGSFLNVVIFRLKNEEQFLTGRSRCLKCNNKLKALDLLPLISFIFLRGKCRYCRKNISWQYPLVELFTALLFLLNFHFLVIGNFNQLEFFRNLIVISALIVIFVYDLKWMLISELIIIPAIFLVAGFNWFLGYSLTDFLIAVSIGFGFFAIQYYLSGGRWLGSGDLRLGIFIGVLFFWPQVILTLFLTYLIGGFIGSILLITKVADRKSKIPLGVFIVPAILLVLFFGNFLIDWYFFNLLWMF